jgi:hypothetical protein
VVERAGHAAVVAPCCLALQPPRFDDTLQERLRALLGGFSEQLSGWSFFENLALVKEANLGGNLLELIEGAGGIAEGLGPWAADRQVPKFRPGGLFIVHAGGGAGLFSMVIGGWANGAIGSEPVTVAI